ASMVFSCGKWHPEKLSVMLIILRYCDVALSTYRFTSSTLRQNRKICITRPAHLKVNADRFLGFFTHKNTCVNDRIIILIDNNPKVNNKTN
ncbi:hypothetical protein, partial [Moritella viscosa]|uniref:hypothetical protein n=1 Tax=Moritella viscosa TaxID=80854 RepID=UPI001C4A2005